MPLPQLVLKNQFGEESINDVLPGGTTFVGGEIATHTILANLTGSTAVPTAATYAQISAILLPTQLLTGFTSGAGTVAATDTTLQAIQKLSGNTQNKAVGANVLTGLVAGANTPITAADTLLVALANLQAQIDAL